jgi:hypothetical protein
MYEVVFSSRISLTRALLLALPRERGFSITRLVQKLVFQDMGIRGLCCHHIHAFGDYLHKT